MLCGAVILALLRATYLTDEGFPLDVFRYMIGCLLTSNQSRTDICRVCRSDGTHDKPLYHPCVCTGSIRYIHQECLLQWLKYSKKEYCELCKHKFSFKPIYSPDMPKRLPIYDIITGLVKSIGRALRYWFQSTLVAVAWLGVVPLTACRIYRCLFTGSVSSLLTLPLDMLSTENLVSDCFQGCFVVTCTLCAFISLVWLREQILHGGGPDWLEPEPPPPPRRRHNEPAANAGAQAAAGGNNGNVIGANPVNVAEAPQLANEQQAAPRAPPEEEDDDDNDAAQENDWNPIEWDRAAEELTWERLLGLDGSLVFLEHVFWVVSLNTLFILVFAFCPYHIGYFTVTGLKVDSYFSVTQFDGLLTTMLGYLIISVSLVILHTVAARASFAKFKRVLGLCYVVVKVSLLVVVEIGIFPLVCGWWLDICSLRMFDATLKDRGTSFQLAPGTSMFIHWLVGMVYVFYFASFILLLREVLRPGVLWFLRNLNDPDFNPIHEMIHLPVYRHVRRFLASMVIFGSTVLLMLWLPVKMIRTVLPGFLPYNVMLSSDAPVSELSLELLLLQVVLPALLEQGYTRQWLKGMVRGWCVAIAWLLNIRSYLLGDAHVDNEPAQPQNVQAPEAHEEEPPAPEHPNPAQVADPEYQAGPEIIPPVPEDPALNANPDAENVEQPPQVENNRGEAQLDDRQAADAAPAVPQVNIIPPPAPAIVAPALLAQGGLGAAHQAMLLGGGPTGFQPYKRPSFFVIKILILVVLMCATLFISSAVSYILPVWFGRLLMSVWMGQTKVHELYTSACGLYSCWLVLRAISVLLNWIPQGWKAILIKVKDWLLLGLKSVVVAGILIGLVPFLLGLLFELVVVIPLRVPLDQSPIFFPWQDWALGILHAKIVCAITMMLPHWWLRRAIEQVYNQGWWNMNLKFIMTELCFPVISFLAMCIAVPYVFARGIIPLFGLGFEKENLILRRIYPSIVCMILFATYLVFQLKQFKKLYEHIKNDKYLVGHLLVNYEHRPRSKSVQNVDNNQKT